MIDTSIKLVDKLIQFLKNRNDAEEKTFDKIVSPVFEHLQTIHEDYLQMFEWCNHELEKGTDLSLIAERLMKDRLEQEALRESIIAFINVFLQDKRLSKYELFFTATRYYFWQSKLAENAHGTRSRILLSAMREWMKEDKKESLAIWQDEKSAAVAREDLLKITATSLQAIRRGWTEISERYAALLTQPQSMIIRHK